MSAVASANLEIDYLRGQLNEANAKLKDVKVARELLKKRGFFVDNLWCVADVKEDYDCTEEQAQQVLEMALTNDSTMQQVWMAIADACDTLEIRQNNGWADNKI